MKSRPAAEHGNSHESGGLPTMLFAEKPYRKFSRRMDRKLAKLVAQWEHLAAPNALRSGRFGRQ